MESMVQEKQQQTKRFRWITTLSIIFACVLLKINQTLKQSEVGFVLAKR